MGIRVGARRGVRLRDAVVVLTLLGHLTVAFGFPLPASSAVATKDASRPFPCQNRPCGCATFDECWKGDCCCFTLEQKLAWAETNGFEPPSHVRPLVEARKARPPACCSEGAETPSCCPTDTDCCAKVPTADRPSVRWVVGLFAQKCRGDSPAGWFQAEPALPPAPIFDSIPSLCISTPLDRPHRVVSLPHFPPTPPPRRA